jgi:hypothetical protein
VCKIFLVHDNRFTVSALQKFGADAVKKNRILPDKNCPQRLPAVLCGQRAVCHVMPGMKDYLKDKLSLENLLFMVGSGFVVMLGMMARNGLQKSWKKVKKSEPPLDPSDTETPWMDALLWAGLSGMTVGIARLVGRRLSAEGVAKVMGTNSSKVKVS